MKWQKFCIWLDESALRGIPTRHVQAISCLSCQKRYLYSIWCSSRLPAIIQSSIRLQSDHVMESLMLWFAHSKRIAALIANSIGITQLLVQRGDKVRPRRSFRSIEKARLEDWPTILSHQHSQYPAGHTQIIIRSGCQPVMATGPTQPCYVHVNLQTCLLW